MCVTEVQNAPEIRREKVLGVLSNRSFVAEESSSLAVKFALVEDRRSCSNTGTLY